MLIGWLVVSLLLAVPAPAGAETLAERGLRTLRPIVNAVPPPRPPAGR